jgi:hypothetical protein
MTGPTSEAPSAGETLGVISGDRLCVRCGFSLHGQRVVREPHYRMLCVRCPECSEVASLQEYPVLGAWSRRFWVLVALGWLFLVVVGGLLTWMSVFGTAEAGSRGATAAASRQIGEAFASYASALAEEQPSNPLYRQDGMTGWFGSDDHWVDPDWVAAGGHVEALREARPIGWRGLAVAAPGVFGCWCWGVVWSALLLERRFIRRPLLVLLIGATVAGVVLYSRVGTPGVDTPGLFYTDWGWGVLASEVASLGFGGPAALVTLVFALAGLAAGMRWGRSVLRGLIRLLLPPFLRGPLAPLWHVDGLGSPRARHPVWSRG